MGMPHGIIQGVANAIAQDGFGRPFDDFHELSAEDTDQHDLREYARAALGWLKDRGMLTMPAPEDTCGDCGAPADLNADRCPICGAG